MKKLLFVLLCLVSAVTARAEDIIQAVPFRAEPGLTTDDAFCFSVRMNNTEPIWAYQLDFLLPEGMTLDDTGGLNPFELNPDRFPHSSRGGVITYKHGIAWKQQPDGWYRVIVSPNDATRIEGTEGEVMKVYILTSPDMKPGLYPIKVRGEILVITGSSDIRPDISSSYVSIGESPLATEAAPDLSALTGYLPSWVVGTMGEELKANDRLTELDLTGVTAMGAALTLPNPNTMCYVNTGCQWQDAAESAPLNVVRTDGTDYTSTHLTLDEDYPFALSHTVAAESLTLKRSTVSADWNSLCLPFALTAGQLAEAFGPDAALYRFDGMRDGLLHFQPAEAGEAHTPYLLRRPTASADGTYAFSGVTLPALSAEPEVTDGAARFFGNYAGHVSAMGYYGVTTDARIAVGSESATVRGFKALFDLSDVDRAFALRLHFGEDDDATVIGDVVDGSSATPVDVYTLSGIRIRRQVARSRALDGLPAGIYIINNQKVIVK